MLKFGIYINFQVAIPILVSKILAEHDFTVAPGHPEN